MENQVESEKNDKKREIVIPGEAIVKGLEYLPGDNTLRSGEAIIASRYGLADISDRLVKVIPLAGVYMPRKGNIVIGKITDITFNGWIIDINAPYQAFLSAMDAGRYVNKNDLREYLDFGDIVIGEVFSVKHKSVDLTLRGNGLEKLEGGMIIKINSNKVPRIIGREGSMINMIKKETGCDIIVGQNGLVWINGATVESELFARDTIMFIVERSFLDGLTDNVKEFLDKRNKNKGDKK
ncbi:MAG: exosome complex RNA-binding protein Rrp4 [archaeon]